MRAAVRFVCRYIEMYNKIILSFFLLSKPTQAHTHTHKILIYYSNIYRTPCAAEQRPCTLQMKYDTHNFFCGSTSFCSFTSHAVADSQREMRKRECVCVSKTFRQILDINAHKQGSLLR